MKCTDDYDSKVQEFLDGLNDLSDKTGIYIVVDVNKQEMALTEKDDDVYNLGWNLREDGTLVFDWY